MKSLLISHQHDRYRLFAIFLNQLIDNVFKITQTELEYLTGIDQSTISRLRDLEKLAEKVEKAERAGRGGRLTRKHVLVVARKGLGLDHAQASLLLWLAEGEGFTPWRPGELSEAGIPTPDIEEIRAVNSFRDDPWRAHAAVVDLLEWAFGASYSDALWHRVGTNLLHGNSPEHYVSLYEKLISMEEQPGQRMLVSKFPSILVSPDTTRASLKIMETSGPIRSRLSDLLMRRQEIFLQNVKKYGERTVHSVASLKRFVGENFSHQLVVEQRRSRVEGLINFVRDDKNYPQFHVALIPEGQVTGQPEKETSIEPEVEIAIKSTKEVVIRGTTRDLSNHPATVVCGPSYLHWDDDWAVVSFYLDFERVWKRLQIDGYTDRQWVLESLETILATDEA